MARKTTSVQQLIDMLKMQGHNVTARRRSDGGYLITSIDGEKFKGAKGNTQARGVVGTTLSVAQRTQRATAFENSPIQFKKELRSKIKTLKTAFKEHPSMHHAGMSAKLVRSEIKKYGKKRVVEKLNNLVSIAMGYAYSKNVEVFMKRLENADYGGFSEVIARLTMMVDTLPDRILTKLYNIAYEYDKGMIKVEQASSEMLKYL